MKYKMAGKVNRKILREYRPTTWKIQAWMGDIIKLGLACRR